VCVFESSTAAQEVNTWRGDVARVTFAIPGVPAVGGVRSATLRFRGHDLDHPGAEGWVTLNGGSRIALPADEANDNQTTTVELAVDGRARAGANRVDFLAFERPDGAFFRISEVALVLTGAVACGHPEPPRPRVRHAVPLGVSAFAGLAPDFPRAGLFEILAALERPFTAVLLDFAPVYGRHGLAMYGVGQVGRRPVEPAHLEAVTAFLEAYVAATPDAARRHLQLYLFNGPGMRRAGYERAFDLDPAAFDRAVREDPAVRGDVARYAEALVTRLAPFADSVEVRLVPVLEDDLDQAAAAALEALLRDTGWSGAVGRNPCACARGDRHRVGAFQERHPHSIDATRQLATQLAAPDSLSNDGWAFATDLGGGRLDPAQVPELVRVTQRAGVLFHLWYDPLQGYPVPADGPRRLRFDHPPGVVLSWLVAGTN